MLCWEIFPGILRKMHTSDIPFCRNFLGCVRIPNPVSATAHFPCIFATSNALKCSTCAYHCLVYISFHMHACTYAHMHA